MRWGLVVALFLGGCGTPLEPPKVDQELRQKLFFQCLAGIPKGPEVVKYNDWEEVITACGNQAYYMALKPR